MSTPPSTEVQPFVTAALIDELPDPRQLQAAVKARIEEAYAGFVAERGEVTSAHDTFDLQRRLQATAEQCDAYSRGFKSAGTLIRQLQEEQLVDAVGEQAGVPMSSLTVPTAGGDIHIAPDFKNEHSINPDAVAAVLVKRVRSLHGSAMTNSTPGAFRINALVQAVGDTIEMLMATGKYEPQISKIKAAAAELARAGEDAMAAELLGTIASKRVYQGRVKVERKAPK